MLSSDYDFIQIHDMNWFIENFWLLTKLHIVYVVLNIENLINLLYIIYMHRMYSDNILFMYIHWKLMR